MRAASRFVKACVGDMNLLRISRNTGFVCRFDRCLSVNHVVGTGGRISRENLVCSGFRRPETNANSLFDRDVNAYARNSMNVSRNGGFFRHLTGFLSDSSSPTRGSRGSRESNLLHKGCASFSTATSDVTGTKQVGGSGKQIQNNTVKNEVAGEQITDAKILRTLAQYLWLKDNLEFRLRVVVALGLLVGAKDLVTGKIFGRGREERELYCFDVKETATKDASANITATAAISLDTMHL